MSATGFDNDAVKDRSYIKKNADRMYRQSFGDLPDGTVYRDPTGAKTADGSPVTFQKDRWEQFKDEPVFKDGSSILEKFHELHVDKNFGLGDTMSTLQKNLDTGDFTLPLDIIPEVFVVQPERLPLADMIPRVSTQDDEVVPTPLTDHPDISFGLETTDDTEGSYTYSDPTYDETLSFPVEGYGAATRLEDKLILAASNVHNAESTQEQAFMRAMRQEEERQIILGTDNNASGWDGLNDFIANDEGDTVKDLDPDSASDSDFEEGIRDIIDSAEFEGAARENMLVVTDFDTHKRVRSSLVSRQRYEADVAEVGSGFTAMTVDDVPVVKSNAIPRISNRADGSTYNQAYTVNLDAHYLSMLQEVSMKPLAKIAPQEQFAVDAYGTLVAEDDGAHVQALTVSPTA